MERRAVMAVLVAMMAAGACGGDGAGDGAAPPLTPSPVGSERPAGIIEWVAIFDSAEDPNELDADARELMDRVGGAILVSPAGCHEDLPDELGASRGTYVIGVRGDTREHLREAVRDAGRDPVLEGRFELLCGP